jgi:hypothetical protein
MMAIMAALRETLLASGLAVFDSLHYTSNLPIPGAVARLVPGKKDVGELRRDPAAEGV